MPALIAYDAFYGTMPSSAGLDYLTNFAAGLPAEGFSVMNIWVNLGASFADNGVFGPQYGAMSRVQFVDSVYASVFGKAPTADAQTTLVNSMDFYASYAGSELGARGAVEGILLYLSDQTAGSPYAQAATNFLTQAAAGTAQYKGELLATYGNGT